MSGFENSNVRVSDMGAGSVIPLAGETLRVHGFAYAVEQVNDQGKIVNEAEETVERFEVLTRFQGRVVRFLFNRYEDGGVDWYRLVG